MSQPYKRPPITEAAVEVRIEGEINLKLVERVRDRLLQSYPLPPQSLFGADVELREDASTRVQQHFLGYRLTAADGAGLVSVGPQFISTSRLAPYEGWESFIATARTNWDVWKRVVGWQKIVRVGVRYINRIDIPTAEGESINIDDYLTFTIRGPALDLPPMNSFAINEVRPLGADECQLILNAAYTPSPLVKTTSFLLDLDISRQVNLPQNDEGLWAFVGRIRGYKNTVFEGCITDRARELFNK